MSYKKEKTRTKAFHHKETVDDKEYQRKVKRQKTLEWYSPLPTQRQLRFITSSEIPPPSEEELLPNQNTNAIQNIGLGFNYIESKSIPISIQSSKNYNSNKYHPKNLNSPLPPPPSLSCSLHF